MKKLTVLIISFLLAGSKTYAQQNTFATTVQQRQAKEQEVMKLQLNLNAAQQKQLNTVLQKYYGALKQAYADSVLANRASKVKDISAQREVAIATLLDSAQRVRYKAHMDSVIAIREKRYKKKGS